MSRMRLAMLLAWLGLTAGCVHTYKMASGDAPLPQARLSREAGFFVAMPRDGSFGHQIYHRSGAMTRDAIVAALSAHSRRVLSAKSSKAVSDNLTAARSAGMQYLVQPTILHWEDRATEWSGKRDKISIQLEVIDVATEEVRDATVFSGKSKWATFGGDHPQELLTKPLGQYAATLFGP